MEPMLDLGPDAGVGVFDLFEQVALWHPPQGLALAREDGYTPGHREFLILCTLLATLVAGIAKDIGSIPIQECSGLRYVTHVGSVAHHRIYQSGMDINADMRFHAEMPLIGYVRYHEELLLKLDDIEIPAIAFHHNSNMSIRLLVALYR